MTKHLYKVCAALLIIALVAVFTVTPSGGSQVAAHDQENFVSDPIHNAGPEQQGMSAPDYDADNDGLIDVANLARLNAGRYDLDGDGTVDDSVNDAAYIVAFPDPPSGMGCPADGCTGYELVSDLDFDTNSNGRADSRDAYWNGGAGWEPIGGTVGGYTGEFEGNGHIISNLRINRSSLQEAGLFGRIGGVVRNLGVADADVTGGSGTGALVGNNQGRVAASWATGSVNGDNNAGGLVGYNDSAGVVSTSYAAVSVSNTGANNIGGLVGRNLGAVSASYATGVVTLLPSNSTAGGLVGWNDDGSITASYATGTVNGGANMGGLVGSNTDTGTVTNSYWDTEASGRLVGVGSDDADDSGAIDGAETATDGATGKTSAELRAPTGYTGIYSAWNLDLDGDSTNDNPWDFGADYNYPALSVDFNNDDTATWQEFGAQRRPGPPTISRAWRESGFTASIDEILWVELNPPTDLGSGGIQQLRVSRGPGECHGS